MGQAIDFGTAPAVGFKMTWAGLDYTVTKAHSLTLHGGVPYAEIHWEHACKECGDTVKTMTGLKRKALPWRCKTCNGPDDKDAIERRAYTKQRWAEGRSEARKKRVAEAVSELALVNPLVSAELNAQGIMLCTASYSDGALMSYRWSDTRKAIHGWSQSLAHVEVLRPWIGAIAARYDELLMFS